MMATPTPAEVERIAGLQDPLIRNLQITQCYHELSTVLAQRTGRAANWCTFATWASRQAGQTIRKEDLARLLESRLKHSPVSTRAADRFAAAAAPAGAKRIENPHGLALRVDNFKTAIQRASEAVSRGNKKVFEEIGREFARFHAVCLPDQVPNENKIARFCEELHPGDPPDGQTYLRRAFTHYYQALFEIDPKTRAELILLANVEVGFHEQTRLQPEIAASLDAGLVNPVEFTRLLFAGVFPYSGWLHLANFLLRKLLGRPTAFDLAAQTLLAAARFQLRATITEVMTGITLPSGVRLSLHEDLASGFPDSLQQISNPELSLLLAEHDPTPDSPRDSGAIDWADLPDRLHFILDLFRCYQENQDLFAAPFTPEQVADLKAGRRPAGRL